MTFKAILEIFQLLNEVAKAGFFVVGTVTFIFGILNYAHQIEVTKIKRKSAQIALDILINEQLKK